MKGPAGRNHNCKVTMAPSPPRSDAEEASSLGEVPPSRLHVTPQTITLGRREENDYYAAHDDDDGEAGDSNWSGDAASDRGVQGARLETSGASDSGLSSWYTRILPRNPFSALSGGDSGPRDDLTSRVSNPMEAQGHEAPASYRSLNDGLYESGRNRHDRDGVTSRGTQSRNDTAPIRRFHRFSSGNKAALAYRRSQPQNDHQQPRPPESASVPLAHPILHHGDNSSHQPPHHPASTSVEDEIARDTFFFRAVANAVHDGGGSATGLRRHRRRHGLQGDGLLTTQDLVSSSNPIASPEASARRISASFRTLLRGDSSYNNSTVAAATSSLSAEFGYRDAATAHVALAPPVLSRYHAKYELLNHPTAREQGRRLGFYLYNEGDNEGDYHDDDDDLSEGGNEFYDGGGRHPITSDSYDLELCEQVGPLSKAPRTDSATLSSLLYRNDRGRVLLRLPSDQVRLVMDPDLRPGILSVEQWRECEQEYRDESSRPSLHYVLTVQEDLYRKIVGEMSDSVTNPYCGMNRCCSEKEFVDIRVALAIVGFTLSILLLLTFVWPVS